MGRGALGVLGMVLVTCVLLLGAGAQGVAAGPPAGDQSNPLVILFENGQKSLNATHRAAIQRLLSEQKPGPERKLLVLGYSDGRGNPKKNTLISQQRAEAVRKEILRASGTDPRHVLAVGRGAENPVGDDRQPQGRARNRRVEIYWTQSMDSSGKPIAERKTVSPAVAAMVQEARALIRRRQLIEAVRLLEQARAQGGEGDGHWQAVYGIAGYYAGMSAQIVKNHLAAALELDPFNQEARDYLGRITAREKVADGVVGAHMGRSEQDPIPVSSDAQAHEYLQLFDVQPLSRQRSLTRPVEAWQCRDHQGRQVVYFFDRSQVYTWAFARNGSDISGPQNARTPLPAPAGKP
ncbi:MAG: OmpA family protein [Desulfobacteraceae bacterium]|nr:OmpA family protein [Desulfobacteraceae bacterium]